MGKEQSLPELEISESGQALDPCLHEFLVVSDTGEVLARQSNLLAAMDLAAQRGAHVEGRNGFTRTFAECYAWWVKEMAA